MTNFLNTDPNLSDYDDTYQMIIDMHLDLTESESVSTNAKLILALVNHIGDSNVVREAVDIARENTLKWRN